MAQAEGIIQGLKREAVQVDKKIESLLDRIVETENPRVIAAYEKRLSKLETDKLILMEKQRNGVKPAHSFDDLFELATSFLANPWKLWESGQLTLKRTVLRLAFSERIAYCRNEGLRTPKTTLPFKVLEGLHIGKCKMAEPKGFEPSIPFPVYSLSRGAPSTTRPQLRGLCSLLEGWGSSGISTFTVKIFSCDQRSVNFSSIRRFSLRSSGLSPVFTG